MNRRSFLWQGLCSSLPLFAKGGLSAQVAPLPVPSPTDARLTAFSRSLTGTVFRPGNSKYEQLRKGYAAKFDAHPLLVVQAAGAADIRAILDFVSANRLPLAVRCGGHSYAGYSSCDGGIVLDMSRFRDIAISADKSHASVGGGMLCGAVEIETARAGVATVLGQCPSVGVGGFLLGGGVSPLMSQYGIGCDNVLAADVILADGRELKASSQHNPDLYWAIRGGGGNFGVVTAFEVALHPVSRLLAGFLTLQAPDLRTVLRAFRDFAASAPDGLTLIALLSAGPDQKPRMDLQVCFAGYPASGEKALAPLRRHPAVVHDTVQLRPYLELEQMVPADIPPDYQEHCSGFFRELDDRRIEILANAFSSAPVAVDGFLIHLHGAVTRVPADATAFPLRRDGIACDLTAYWKPAAGRRAAEKWVQELSAVLPVDPDGDYVNVMDRVEERTVQRAYGVNYARLQHLKARYDPNNLFSLNQNIQPA
ncbi:MAG TPA: FAD-binding oxidoreductase [Acidobacteriaceae bacterium]|jgi:FAD/FMN-containing dehydrogenase